ncbi:hypothetical protein FCN13_03195 [Pseudomonas sp. UMC631]|nr:MULTISPECIES: hypothetical protein [unclassified Pseudomonas]NTX87963.1 hypothetical protein [Pseudomonas sp. UMA643]NTY17011.1 hypothetical protein [Pseudomonas sp. UMC3103]NTY22886.1 hypothetical protein [Pseudomonas sp. UMA603]NTY29531.1 hypothetical protein [Pseudomonas sp. UMC3129]NTY52601.1 hypothetical protein [Pseudomonas sp. UMC631]
MLGANLDALFDAGLITFEDNGNMRVSADLTEQQQKSLGLPMGLCKSPTLAQQRYLKHHRDKGLERWKYRLASMPRRLAKVPVIDHKLALTLATHWDTPLWNTIDAGARRISLSVGSTMTSGSVG